MGDQLIDELVGRAQGEVLQLTGEGGLLQQLTKRLLVDSGGRRNTSIMEVSDGTADRVDDGGDGASGDAVAGQTAGRRSPRG